MTCVVGLIQDGKVHMACDSAASDGDSGIIMPRKDPKMFYVNEYLIGFSNSFRMGQILQHDFVPPKPTKRNLEKVMAIDFPAAIHEALDKNKFAMTNTIDDSKDSDICELMIGVHGRLFTMDTDFSIGEYHDPYFAIGSGYQFALGSLFTTQHIKTPKARLTRALEAATKFTMSVEPPYLYETL